MVKKYSWERLTGSGKVSPSPVNIGTLILTPNDSAQGKVTLYDGESSGDPVIAAIKTGSGQSMAINFQFLLSTKRGLYIDFTTTMTEVLVIYETEEE